MSDGRNSFSWTRASKGFSTLLVMLQFLLKLGDAGLQLRPLFDQFPDNRSCYWKFLFQFFALASTLSPWLRPSLGALARGYPLVQSGAYSSWFSSATDGSPPSSTLRRRLPGRVSKLEGCNEVPLD